MKETSQKIKKPDSRQEITVTPPSPIEKSTPIDRLKKTKEITDD
jgi:hypothetical protein